MSIEVVRKRLSIRSWRRGTKELDLILGRFSDKNLTKFDRSELDLYEYFISKEDHFIYAWLFQKEDCPEIFKSLVQEIKKEMLR